MRKHAGNQPSFYTFHIDVTLFSLLYSLFNALLTDKFSLVHFCRCHRVKEDSYYDLAIGVVVSLATFSGTHKILCKAKDFKPKIRQEQQQKKE